VGEKGEGESGPPVWAGAERFRTKVRTGEKKKKKKKERPHLISWAEGKKRGRGGFIIISSGKGKSRSATEWGGKKKNDAYPGARRKREEKGRKKRASHRHRWRKGVWAPSRRGKRKKKFCPGHLWGGKGGG